MKAPSKKRGVENRRRVRRGRVYWTYRIRFDDHHGERRSEEFDRQSDAVDRKAEIALAKRRRKLHELFCGEVSLGVFVETRWWPLHALENLETATLTSYESVYRLHIEPYLGHLAIRDVDIEVAAMYKKRLREAGVGAPTIRKALAILQGIISYAILVREATWNVFAFIEKPALAKSGVRPLPPIEIETILQHIRSLRSRILIGLIAYAGLRPEEALALEWRHIRERTILVEQVNVDGEILPRQKVVDAEPRPVDLCGPLADDIREYRASLPSQLPTAYVVGRVKDGLPWRDHDYRNWRRNIWQKAVVAVGLGTLTLKAARRGERKRWYTGPRPYDLRHSWVSLQMLAAELSMKEIADMAGHSLATMLKDYAHVIAELKGQANVPFSEQILRARAAVMATTTRRPAVKRPSGTRTTTRTRLTARTATLSLAEQREIRRLRFERNQSRDANTWSDGQAVDRPAALSRAD